MRWRSERTLSKWDAWQNPLWDARLEALGACPVTHLPPREICTRAGIHDAKHATDGTNSNIIITKFDTLAMTLNVALMNVC